MNNKEQIVFRIISESGEHLISSYRHEYRSLMALIRDKLYPESFGECGGQGRCATCIVKLDATNEIPGRDRNEPATLAKIGVVDPAIRLSCQLQVDMTLHNATVYLVYDE